MSGLDSRIRVSPEEASVRLRKRISSFRYRHFRSIAWVAWLIATRLILSLALLVFETIVFYSVFGNTQLFAAAFLAGNAVIVGDAAIRIKRRLWKGRKRGSILIGRSFAHFTESSDRSGTPVEVGADSAHYLNYISEPNPHVLMLGSTSSGKTTTMRAFVSRVAIADRIPFLMLDWNGENEEWAKSAGAAVWRVPEHFKVNLFKLNGMGRESRASIAVEGLAAAAHLTALQSTKVKSALLRFYMEGREPSLLELWKAVCYRNASKANVLDQRLRAIQRVIGCEPEEFWSGVFERNSVISMMGLNGSEKALVAYAILQRLAELFDKDPWKGRKPRLMVVIDEAWQLLRREKEFDTLKESVAERIVRLGRKYGVGIIVSTQQLDDVPKVFVNSSSLLMVHQHREASWFGRDLLQLNRYESAYMRSAAQGEMLLFDRGRAQEGIWYSEYVKVEPLSSRELQSLAGTSTAYSPRRISEPEMPLELADAGQEEPAEEGKPGILNGLEIPSVVLYRFLVALSRTGKPRDANRMLKERGWITSDTTIYGNSSKPSILARAQGGGYVSGDAMITEKGLKLIDPDRLIARQGIYAGSEEHKELMKKAIRLIQDKGNLAFTLSGKDSFDVGEIRAKTKSSWDLEHITAYECQTNAIKEEIEKCVVKADRLGLELVFIVASNEVADSIRLLTENRYAIVLPS